MPVGRLLAILVLVLAASFAGGRRASAQHLPLQMFDEESGLANASIDSLAQDRAGFLYAGTEAGLFRYDGFRFERVGLADGISRSGEVEAVLPGPDGRIWVVFDDRVFLTGSGATVSVPVPATRQETAAHRADTMDGDLLLVRDGRLLRIHPNVAGALSAHAMAVPAGTALDAIYVEHGTVWLDCGGSLCRLSNGRLAPIAAAAGLPADRWTALLRDDAGTLWLRSATRIAWRPAGAGHFNVIKVPGGPGRFHDDPERVVLVEDAAGDVVTQGAHGLLVHQDGAWAVYDHAVGLANSEVTTMLRDHDGSLWLGTKARGVGRAIGLGVFEDWTQSSGLSDDLVWNIARDGSGTLWAANDIAVDPVVDGADAAIPAPDRKSLPFRAYALAASPQGRLWIGLPDGRLIRRDPRTGQSLLVATVASVRTLAVDPSGVLWVGTRHGLMRIDRPDDAMPMVVPDLSASEAQIFAIAFDGAGDPWILTQTKLFYRDAQHRWQAVLRTDPLGGYQTHEMAFASDGTLWLGSFTTGITRLHLDHGAVVAQDRLPTSHLASDDVEMLRADPAGRMWIGTDHGVDVTDGTIWRHLDDQDGLAGNDTNENAAFIDHDGSPWFGTAGGLAHLLDPARVLRAPPQHLRPVVTRLSVGDVALPFASIRSGVIHLHWSGDPLVIGFSSLAFGLGKSVRFQYRLRGVDRGWVQTIAHEVRYPDPPSGKLVFEVMAVDPLHRLESAPARLVIKLRAPWWRTWPTLAGLAVLIAASVVALWQLRVRYLLARQHQLEKLVAERTHEIEQARLILFKQATSDSLTGLANRSAILERLREAIAATEHDQSMLAVALLDLDHFKRVNDVFGHLDGDAVLREVGARLAASLRDSDHAGRYGGEELLLVLPGLRPRSYERLRGLLEAVFAQPFTLEQTEIRMTASMGVTWMLPSDDLTAMIRRADAALYAAKRGGRDRFVCDPPQS